MNNFIKFTDFQSSNINTLWYSSGKQQLIVEYKGGAQYRYDNISQMEWDGLIASESKGKFINESIKSKPYQKMILND